MAKRSGPLQYTQLLPGDPDLVLLGSTLLGVREYVVTILDAARVGRQVFASVKNFAQAFRTCKAQAGNAPRCFVKELGNFFAVNAAKMPH
jgi:hypothetical protein